VRRATGPLRGLIGKRIRSNVRELEGALRSPLRGPSQAGLFGRFDHRTSRKCCASSTGGIYPPINSPLSSTIAGVPCNPKSRPSA
jgi:hypothetical protein